MEKEAVARMMGYVWPMEADEGRHGPLGNAKLVAVRWLRQVIEEEGNITDGNHSRLYANGHQGGIADGRRGCLDASGSLWPLRSRFGWLLWPS